MIMADSNQELVFSNDPMMIIAQYLSPKELSALKSVSHLLNNNALSKVALLQPLYNRLFDIDKTLPILLSDLNPDNSFLGFKHAFDKIQTKQQEEIAFLKEKHPDLELPKISGSPLEILKQTDIILNEINIDIIREAAKNRFSSRLILKHISRFIIPNDCKDYFAKFKIITCTSSILSTLNLQECLSLEELYFNYLSLKNLNLEGCATLQILNCWMIRELSTLNLKGCSGVQKLPSIQSFGSITELNIQGASQEVQNTLGSLEEKLLFKKLSDATYIERDEIIERLGKRYNSTNCIKYGCYYEVASLECQYISSFMPYFSIPQKEDLFMDVENKNKRKRISDNNNDNEEPVCKRNKPD